MNCERAEGYLSAFLDGALDPRLSQQVRAHVAECAHCRAILDDFRSFDHLLATTPRIEPPQELRDRIFDSDEYRRILADRDAERERAASRDADDVVLPDRVPPDLQSPDLISPISPVSPDALADAPDLPELFPLDPDLAHRGSDGAGLDELLLPDLADFSEADFHEIDQEFGALTEIPGDEPSGAGFFAFARVGSSLWSRVLLPAAAVLTLTLGAALLMKQGIVPFSTGSTPGLSTTLGNPSQQGIPLAAGPRVVYLHDGILWSAPESGPGIAQPLTPSGSSGVTVGAWSVSPNGGQFVAYVDQRSGKLHVVRSDGLSDHVVATNVVGGLAWSPDAARIAYLTGGRNGHVLYVVNADGTNAQAVSAAGIDAGSAAWSHDGAWLAFTESRGGTTSVWSYNLASNSARQLVAQADALDAQASVAQLAWLPDAQHPALTWATSGSAGIIEGVYSQSADGTTGSARQLAPTGARYTSAAYTSAHSDGAWLVADGNALSLLDAASGSRTVVATLDMPASRIVWSPSGVAAVTHGNALALWSADSGLTGVDTGLNGIAPVWSSDGANLLYAKAGSVQIAHVTNGQVDTMAVMQAVEVDALGIAPDSQSIAVVTSGGVVLTSADGAHAKLVDHHTPQDGNLAWSVAG